MKITLLLVLLFVILTQPAALPGNVISIESKIKLSEKVLLQAPISFCVTEDEVFIVVDFKAGDVKIYNSNGDLAVVLGRKGFGPNEFAQPLFCHYENNRFVISDVGQRKFFIYERKDNFVFVRSKEIHTVSLGDDICLEGNKLYIAGNKAAEDNKYYSFFALDLEKESNYTYFLPSYLKFGFNSNNEYKTELFKKPDLTAMGTHGLFYIRDNFAYYIWEGDLKIFRINLKTKEISTFGKKFPHYVKPYTTKKLTEAFFSRNGKYVKEERSKMSYLKQIFTTKRHVMVLYTIPGKNGKEQRCIVQIYKLNGNFVEEVAFPGKVPYTMWFDKENMVLYVIKLETDSDFDESYYILKYKIHENTKD